METNFYASPALARPVAQALVPQSTVVTTAKCKTNCIEFVIKKGRTNVVPYLVLLGQQTLRDCWFELEESVNSCSVGMIFRTGPQNMAVAELLSEGFHGGVMPGAIAIIGSDDVVMDRLKALVCLARNVGAIPFEWPPILVSLRVTDPALVRTMQAACSIAELGVQLELDVFDGEQPAQRVQAFMQKHLVQHFPKMF